MIYRVMSVPYAVNSVNYLMFLEFRVSEEKIDALKTLMEPDLRNLGIETFPIQLGNEEWITLNGLALRVALTNAGG